MKNKTWKKIKAIQSKIDLTPHVLKIVDKTAKKGNANIFLFALLLIIGFFGLLLPIIQGWLVIVLSFTALGIKPLNNFINKNKGLIESVGTFLFLITFTLIIANTLTWAFGVTENSPVDNVVGMVTWGQEDIEQFNNQTMSIVGLDYKEIQQAMSLVDYDNTQGWSLIGIE